MQPFFIFKNVSSKDMGVLVNKLPHIIKPTRDISKIEVQGREGFLAEDLGTYRSITKSVECTIKNLDKIDEICAWLDGTGEVIFSNQKDRKFKATIINQIQFSKVIRQFHSFIIQFECQPHPVCIGNSSIILTKKSTIFNPTNYKSKPVLKVCGSGDIDLTINNDVIHLSSIDGYVTIDSELMDAYKGTELKNNCMSGEFPELQIGQNKISWTGDVEKLEIIPNWRWL